MNEIWHKLKYHISQSWTLLHSHVLIKGDRFIPFSLTIISPSSMIRQDNVVK